MSKSKYDEKIKNIEANLYDAKSPSNIDFLLDCFSSIVYELSAKIDPKNKLVNSVIDRLKPNFESIQKNRIGLSDFTTLKVLGKGAFGEVVLVRHKETSQIYALKCMNKSEMVKREEALCLWEEREIMALSNSDWIVKMYYSFQDQVNIYMVMEFVQGGDMVNFMENYEIDEDVAKFYLAELCLGLDFLHNFGFIHRDVKPDNMLLDHNGHLKICDFGTCIRLDKNGKVSSSIAVGTPDYISPEVLLSQNSPTKYGKEVDWWSVGIFLYEFLLNDTPFYSKSLVGTYNKILNYQKHLEFPQDESISKECESMIRGFLCSPDIRLGMKGMDEIKNHSFFNNISWKWDNIRQHTPPVVPNLENESDASCFEGREENDLVIPPPSSKNFEHFPFVGFSFSGDYIFGGKKSKSENIDINSNENNKKLRDLEKLCNQLQSTVDSKENYLKNSEVKINEIAKLKDVLETENENLKVKIKAIQKEIDDSTEEIKKFEVQIKYMKKNDTETQKRCDELVGEVSQLKDSIELLKGTKLKLELQIKDLTSDRNQSKSSLEEIDKNYKELKSSHQILRNEIDKIKLTFKCKSIEELKNFVETMQNEKSQMVKNLTNYENKIKNYEQTLKEKVGEGTKESVDKLEMDFKIKNLQDEKNALVSQINSLDVQTKDLSHKNMKLTQNLTQITEENSNLNQKFDDLTAKYNTSVNQESKLMSEKNDILILNFELKSRLDRFVNLSRDFDRQSHNFEEKFSYFESKINSQTAKISEIEKNLNQREKNVITLNEKIKLLEKDINEKSQIIQGKDLEVNNLKTTIEKLEALLTVQGLEIDTSSSVDETLKKEMENLRKSFEEYKKKAEKTIETEKLLKEESIKKLNQILSAPQFQKVVNNTIKAKSNRNDRKVDQLYKQLQMDYIKLREENSEMTKVYEAKISELNTIILDLQSTVETLKKDKGRDRYDIKQEVTVSPSDSGDPFNEIIKQDFLCYPAKMAKSSRKINWSRVIVTLTKSTLIIYKSTEVNEASIMHKIQIGLIYYVRPISQNDLYRSKASDIPKIFQIIFNDDADASVAFTNEISNDKCTIIGNHCLINIQYHMPATCDVCGKGLWGFIKSSYAMECKNCHFKCHREHSQEPKSIPQCRDYENRRIAKEILLMADDSQKQKAWIDVLLSKMKSTASLVPNTKSPRKNSSFGSGLLKNSTEITPAI